MKSCHQNHLPYLFWICIPVKDSLLYKIMLNYLLKLKLVIFTFLFSNEGVCNIFSFGIDFRFETNLLNNELNKCFKEGIHKNCEYMKGIIV